MKRAIKAARAGSEHHVIGMSAVLVSDQMLNKAAPPSSKCSPAPHYQNARRISCGWQARLTVATHYGIAQ